MKLNLLVPASLLMLFTYTSCSEATDDSKDAGANPTEIVDDKEDQFETSEPEVIKPLSEYVPEGYVIFDTIYGDLNKDSKEDCILIIKGTDETEFIDDEYRGELDVNRRGIIVLLKEEGNYDVTVKNVDCFSSENEDGGVYFAPELNVYVEDGKMFVHYAHGRYGYWKYTFRYQQDDLELIGYDNSENYGPIVSTIESYNFLSKRKLVKENTNVNAETEEDEVFEETWSDIEVNELIKLSTIDDFDGLYFYHL